MLMFLATWADRRRLGGRRAEAAFRGWAGDAAVAVAVAAVDLVGAWDEAHSTVQGDPSLRLPPVPGWAYALVGLAGLALVARRKWPLASFFAVSSLTFIYTVLGYNDGAPFLAMAVSLYSLATVLNPRPVWLTLAIAVLACEGALVLFGPFGIAQGPVTVVPWELAAGAGIGLFVASRRAQAARLRERTEEDARRRVEQERLRIARELHDVVAHSMATINVQAGVALHLLKEQSPGGDVVRGGAATQKAVEAMEAVRLTSKEALRELRGMLNLLRSSSEEPEPTAPAPRLSQVGDLLDITAKAGLPAELRVLGERRDLPPAVDLAGYRIVQEALTNTLRHAGPARATVVLAYGPDRLIVEVSDDGQGAPVTGTHTGDVGAGGAPNKPGRAVGRGQPGVTAGAGKGLIGMRERAEALGGSLEATPLASGGFRVRAELPLPSDVQQGPSKARGAGRPLPAGAASAQ